MGTSEWTIPLLSFAGLCATNIVISLLLWWNDRTPLHRLLSSFWIAAVVAVATQAVVPKPPASIAAFGIPLFVMNLSLADFLRRTLALGVRWRTYAVVASACAFATVAAAAVSAPFWIAALPTALGVSFPLFDVLWQAVRRAEELSVSARCMLVAVLMMALHDLDYPFLRYIDAFIPYGFSIAIVTMFGLSITAPAMILEGTVAEVRRLQAKALERERFSALGEAASVVAHEVRNPLATMMNTIELLRREAAISDDGRELLSIQAVEVLRLDRLVRDLLSFSKPLEPTLGDVDLAAVIQYAVRSLRVDAEAAHVELTVDDSGERLVHGDQDSIHVALVNVLRNAIEASPDGGTVRVATSNGDSKVAVMIEDEGEGVSDDVIGHIWKPFVTTRATGSGLGLAIVDRIMKVHGGEVRVTNRSGKGARFELVFHKAAR